MAEVQDISSIEQFNNLILNATPTTLVALNFHAPWAAPCMEMNKVFASLAGRSSPTTTLFISIDAEEYPDISEAYDVSAVPFFVLLRASQVLERISGADPTKLTKTLTDHSASASNFILPPPQPTTATAAPTITTTATEEDQDEGGEEDITERLSKLVKAAPVMLFMKGTPAAPQCGFSRKLVALLREKEVRYGFFNILADDDVRQGLKTFSDWPTFPQLYLEGQLVGGLDIVNEEFEHNPDFLSNPSSA